MINRDQFTLDTFPHEVMARVDVFCLNMMLWVLCKSFRPLVVNMQRDCVAWPEVEFRQKVSDPQTFLARVRQSFIL